MATSSPVEGACCAESVCTHLAPGKPIAHIETLWKLHELPHAIDRIASRSPHASSFGIVIPELNGKIDGELNIGRRWERWNGMNNIVRNGQRVRVDDLMVKHDAVEGAIYAIVDVVCIAVSQCLARYGGRSTYTLRPHLRALPWSQK